MSCVLVLYLEPLQKLRMISGPHTNPTPHCTQFLGPKQSTEVKKKKKKKMCCYCAFIWFFNELISWISERACLAWNFISGVTLTCEQEHEEILISSYFHFSQSSHLYYTKKTELALQVHYPSSLHDIKRPRHLLLFLPQPVQQGHGLVQNTVDNWVLCWMRLSGGISILTGPLLYYCYI